VRCVRAAAVLAAAFSVCVCCVSAAPSWAGDDGAQYLLFTGGDLWRNGAFTYGGLLWSPDGLDREGFTLKAVIPATVLAADGSISTIITSYSARIADGWRAFDRFCLGPEAQMFASDGYRQMRLGAHLTGFKTEDAEWAAAAGWSDDSDHRTSLYVRLGVLTRR
jgi:Cellulose biosynthesis protein BcsS